MLDNERECEYGESVGSLSAIDAVRSGALACSPSPRTRSGTRPMKTSLTSSYTLLMKQSFRRRRSLGGRRLRRRFGVRLEFFFLFPLIVLFTMTLQHPLQRFDERRKIQFFKRRDDVVRGNGRSTVFYSEIVRACRNVQDEYPSSLIARERERVDRRREREKRGGNAPFERLASRL